VTNARHQQIKDHLERLVNVVRNAQLKRALTSVDPGPQLNLWRIIYGNLMDVAVLEWCKIFGSNTEPSHWKSVVPPDEQLAFKYELLAALETDEAGWKRYWNQMKAYRDKLIAHQQQDPGVRRYPTLEMARESSYFYWAYLIIELKRISDTYPVDDLRQYSERFANQARKIARRALASTAGINEEVF
jgi:hypothetical protein